MLSGDIIIIKSYNNIGSTISFWVPINVANNKVLTPVNNLVLAPTNNTGIRILHIEDSDVNFKLLSYFVKKVFVLPGIELHKSTFKDIPISLETCIFDIIFIGVNIHNIKKVIEAVSIVRKHNNKVYIVAITPHKTICKDISFNDYIIAPIDKYNLINCIQGFML